MGDVHLLCNFTTLKPSGHKNGGKRGVSLVLCCTEVSFSEQSVAGWSRNEVCLQLQFGRGLHYIHSVPFVQRNVWYGSVCGLLVGTTKILSCFSKCGRAANIALTSVCKKKVFPNKKINGFSTFPASIVRVSHETGTTLPCEASYTVLFN